jgi:hypothetical protein
MVASQLLILLLKGAFDLLENSGADKNKRMRIAAVERKERLSTSYCLKLSKQSKKLKYTKRLLLPLAELILSLLQLLKKVTEVETEEAPAAEENNNWLHNFEGDNA